MFSVQLDQYGELVTIVVGKFLEMSEGGHQLLDAMARSRVAKLERQMGQASFNAVMEKGPPGRLTKQVGLIYRFNIV